MCLMVYAAAAQPLPIVSWKEATPTFYVSGLLADDVVRSQFDYPYVYELGSHEGCGCGFVSSDMDEDEARRDQKASVEALHRYLEAERPKTPIQLFMCWAGGESMPRPKLQPLLLEQVRDPAFWTQAHAEAIDDRATAWDLATEGDS